jgi:hypothetical protein
MDFEELNLGKFNWNKIVKTGMVILIAMVILQTMIFVVCKSAHFVTRFNKYFDQQQSMIHNKIESELVEFNTSIAEMDKEQVIREKEFDKNFENFQVMMGLGKIQGKKLADIVSYRKKEYEDLLAKCKEDKECVASLNK